MPGRVLSGIDTAHRIQEEVARGVRQLGNRGSAAPMLASVAVGADPAAKAYVRQQESLASELGIRLLSHELSGRANTNEVAAILDQLGSDPEVDGVVLQLPLPDHLDEPHLVERLPPRKDIDGLHPVNLARLATRGREPHFASSTALAAMALLGDAGAKLAGAEAVVVGRSRSVGLPTGLLLMGSGATVTFAHTGTRDLGAVTRRAEVLITAAGKPGLVRADMVRPGAVVIDIGTSAIQDPDAPDRSRWMGDVAFEEVREVASALTPVPGGVGPVTVAMLMRNALLAARRRLDEGSA